MAAFGTIPGGVYTLLEKFVLRSNTAVMGARYADYTLAGCTSREQTLTQHSVWVFLLLSAEIMKTHKTNPYFRYTDSPTFRTYH
jgi:hypothetical protein